MNNVSFKTANRNDCGKILNFIKALAEYENMSNQVITNEKQLEDEIFNKKGAEVIFAVYEGKEVGFALYLHNFSTFLGKRGLYLEDLFILPEYRGLGIGKATLKKLAQTAVERNCGRLEWACLDWNEPSIQFYLSLGAEQMTEWTTYRLTEEKIKELANS